MAEMIIYRGAVKVDVTVVDTIRISSSDSSNLVGKLNELTQS